MAHSFVFYCPLALSPDPYVHFSESEYVQFLTCHVVLDNHGYGVVGYVQFVFKRTEESLNKKFPVFKFMQSVNDPEVYSNFVNPTKWSTHPETYGNPRPKTRVKEHVNFLKKKAKEALKKCMPSKRDIINASLALLQGPPRVL